MPGCHVHVPRGGELGPGTIDAMLFFKRIPFAVIGRMIQNKTSSRLFLSSKICVGLVSSVRYLRPSSHKLS